MWRLGVIVLFATVPVANAFHDNRLHSASAAVPGWSAGGRPWAAGLDRNYYGPRSLGPLDKGLAKEFSPIIDESGRTFEERGQTRYEFSVESQLERIERQQGISERLRMEQASADAFAADGDVYFAIDEDVGGECSPGCDWGVIIVEETVESMDIVTIPIIEFLEDRYQDDLDSHAYGLDDRDGGGSAGSDNGGEGHVGGDEPDDDGEEEPDDSDEPDGGDDADVE